MNIHADDVINIDVDDTNVNMDDSIVIQHASNTCLEEAISINDIDSTSTSSSEESRITGASRVLSDVLERTKTPNAHSIVYKEVWDKLDVVGKALARKETEEFVGDGKSDTSNLSFMWNRLAMQEDQKKTRGVSGYIRCGKTKWNSLSAAEKAAYMEKARELRKLDVKNHPPAGYNGNIRLITLPDTYLEQNILQK